MNDMHLLKRYTSESYGFEQLVTSLDHMEHTGMLATEFERLPGSALFPVTVGKTDAASKKNRWKEIVPYDHNRVILCQSGVHVVDIDGDYINASFIRGFRNEDGYIATQGPMLGTVEDFWNMVWAENSRLLVMMCRLVERCQSQSYKYWPDVGDCIDVDNITISTDLEDQRGTYVIRKFLLRQSQTGESREITHLQFLAWPDNVLPCVPTFVNFWKTFRRFKTSSSGLPVVHCSDGSQRAGLVIALDSIISQWEATSCVDIFSCAARIRGDRIGSFATLAEYVYLHRAAVEAYLSRETFREDVMSRKKDNEHLTSGLTLNTPPEEIMEEFKVLDRQRPTTAKLKPSSFQSSYWSMSPGAYIQGTLQSYQLIFPSDTGGICVTCVPLQHQRKSTSSGERPSRLRHSVSLQENEIFLGISGVVPSDCKSSFLVTAAPPTMMSVDFWHIIFDTGCRTIVRLTESAEEMTSQTDKWPLYTQDFSLSMTSQSVLRETVTETTMLMRSEIEPAPPLDCDIPSEVPIKIFNMEWSRDGRLIPSYETLLVLFKRINRWLRQTASTLIAVQCNDGQSTSGHFCAAYNILSLLQMDNSVDIYLTAREVQDRLPQSISQEQYQHLYTLCEHFLHQRQEQLNRLHSNDSSMSVRGDSRTIRAVASTPIPNE